MYTMPQSVQTSNSASSISGVSGASDSKLVSVIVLRAGGPPLPAGALEHRRSEPAPCGRLPEDFIKWIGNVCPCQIRT
jgi:hypothetical protein